MSKGNKLQAPKGGHPNLDYRAQRDEARAELYNTLLPDALSTLHNLFLDSSASKETKSKAALAILDRTGFPSESLASSPPSGIQMNIPADYLKNALVGIKILTGAEATPKDDTIHQEASIQETNDQETDDHDAIAQETIAQETGVEPGGFAAGAGAKRPLLDPDLSSRQPSANLSSPSLSDLPSKSDALDALALPPSDPPSRESVHRSPPEGRATLLSLPQAPKAPLERTKNEKGAFARPVKPPNYFE